MRSRRLGALLVVALLSIASASRGAPNDPPSAAELARADAAFKEGRVAFAKKDFAGAAAAFERALAIVPHAKTAYLAGLAYDEGGDSLHAAGLFERSLSLGGLASEQEREARARVAAIDGKTARVSIDAPGAVDVRVDDAAVEAGKPVRLTPGRHTIRARFASGREASAIFEAVAGASETMSLAEPREPPVAPLPEPPAKPPAPVKPPPPNSVTPNHPFAPRERGPSRLPYDVAGGVAFGLSGIGLIAMIGLGEHAIAVRDQFVEGGAVSADLHDQAVASKTGANVALALSIGFAATGVVLFSVAPRGRVVVAPTAASLQVAF